MLVYATTTLKGITCNILHFINLDYRHIMEVQRKVNSDDKFIGIILFRPFSY